MIPYKIDIIIGGAPCTNFSFAGRRKGMVTTENMFITSLNQYITLKNEGFEFVGQSYLYWEYVRLVDLFKPEYFLLENVHMNKLWENVISKGLGVTPIRINSSLLSAQNRKRLYWTNIPGVTIPEDRKIMLSDIITDAVGGGGRRNRFNGNYHPDGRKKQDLGKYTTRKDGKSNCLTCGSGSCDKVTFTNGDIRPLSIDEWEILQTLPVGYTDVPGLSITSRKCSIGNAWTVDVISHIFSFIPNL
jgi:DNA (cytosine-5)-methyltransferase 3A